jgi:hypothetical protein
MLLKRIFWLCVVLGLLSGIPVEKAGAGSLADEGTPALTRAEVLGLLDLDPGPGLPPGSESLPARIDPTLEARAPLVNYYPWIRLTYQTILDGNWEIITAGSDGGGAQRATSHKGSDVLPRLNRGADRVVFSSDRDGDFDIYTMNLDGSDLRQVTHNTSKDTAPVWSPDGSRIAYSSYETGMFEIYVIHADGSGKQRLTNNYTTGGQSHDPDWSPDGTRIAFVTRNYKNEGHLYVVSPGGAASPVKLTSTTFKLPATPRWSHDGKRIAMAHSTSSLGLINALFMMDVATGVQLAQEPELSLSASSVIFSDVLVGGWSTSSEALLLNQLEYEVVGSQLVFSGAYMVAQCQSYSAYPCNTGLSTWRLAGTGMDFSPHWGNGDIVPPATHMLHLPQFSRATGFAYSWQVFINGLAPLKGVVLQYQHNQEAWSERQYYGSTLRERDWLSGYTYNFGQYLQPGDTVSFRVRSYDAAGNQESYPAAPDTTTRLFTYLLSGRAADARGFPLANSVITLNPEPLAPFKLSQHGAFRAYLKTWDAYTVQAQAAGHGALPVTPQQGKTDLVQDFYFPPPVNLIQNGSFESGTFDGWTVSETVTATPQTRVTTNDSFTGVYGAQLGAACPWPCLLEKEPLGGLTAAAAPVWESEVELLPFAPQGGSDYSHMGMDAKDNLYVAQWKYDEPPGLVVYERSAEGVWKAPVVLQAGLNLETGREILFSALPTGKVYVLWCAPTSSQTLWAVKDPVGGWSLPADFPFPGLSFWDIRDFQVDAKGGIYLVYGEEYSTFLTYRTPAGAWSPAVNLFGASQLLRTSDGRLHFFYGENEIWRAINYVRLSPDRVLEEKNSVLDRLQDYVPPMFALADDLDRIHLFTRDNNHLYHMMRDVDGTWGAYEQVPFDNAGFPIAWEARGGTIYILSWQKAYWYDPERGWQADQLDSSPSMGMVMDSRGRVFGLSGPDLLLQPASDADQTVSISQAVSIPANAHRPTLAFNARLSGAAGAGSTFQVSVTDGLTTTVIYTQAQPHRWQHVWLPLDGWKGQTVTVTFSLQQAASDPLLALDLDDISLGSWLTPVVQSVSLAPGSRSLTIHGQNFIAMPAVRVGEMIIPDSSVVWVNENTLQVTLPAAFTRGIYDLHVTNPGGPTFLYPGGVRVGWFLHLPLLRR